jgi:hypothetical protein
MVKKENDRVVRAEYEHKEPPLPDRLWAMNIGRHGSPYDSPEFLFPRYVTHPDFLELSTGAAPKLVAEYVKVSERMVTATLVSSNFPGKK